MNAGSVSAGANDGYLSCPLYKSYLKARKECLKEIRKSRWREEERKQLKETVEKALAGLDADVRDWWIERIYKEFCRRLYWSEKTGYLERLSSFSDNQASGKYKSGIWKEHCLRVRDEAVRRMRLCQAGKDLNRPPYG